MTPRWTHAADVAWVGDEDRVVVMALPAVPSVAHALDASGAGLWMELATPHTVAELLEEFGLDPESDADTMAQFLHELTTLGLLTVVE